MPVEEPVGDLELAGVLDDGHELLDLVGGHLTRPVKRSKQEKSCRVMTGQGFPTMTWRRKYTPEISIAGALDGTQSSRRYF